MSIIVITIPDERKKHFVAELQKQTKGAVSLVVLQERPPLTWSSQWQRWRKKTLQQLVTSMFFATLLRLHSESRAMLQVFHSPRNTAHKNAVWAAPVLRVSSVNDPAVQQIIAQSRPTVLAVWGSGLLQSDTIAPAATALNVHLGISSKYRGAYANQRAVERGDWQNIGATIHHINNQADAGAVVMSIPATVHDTPTQTFAELHHTIEKQFISIIKKLLRGETLSNTTPDLQHSENLRLNDWLPERRWQVAKQLRIWARQRAVPVRVKNNR